MLDTLQQTSVLGKIRKKPGFGVFEGGGMMFVPWKHRGSGRRKKLSGPAESRPSREAGKKKPTT